MTTIADNMGTAAGKSDSGNKLIFLVSQPRSGSTLLQVLLSGSPEIATLSEPWIALHPVFAMRDEGLQSVYNARIAKNALADFLDKSGVGTAFFNDQVGKFLTAFYRKAIEKQDKIYFLDKTPRYYHIVDELAQIFPAAKFIILFRNPLAVLHSIFKTWIKDDFASVVNFFEDLWIAPFKLIQFLNAHPDQSICVKYEDFVSRPREVLQVVCRFIGIEFTEKMLAYGERFDSSWKFGDQTGLHKAVNPVPTSIDKWQQGFDTPESASFAMSYLESLGPDTINRLGYDYSGIKEAIELPAGDSSDQILSFSELRELIDGVSAIADVKKAAFIALAEEKKLKKRIGSGQCRKGDRTDSLVVHTLQGKLHRMKNEMRALRGENIRLQSEVNRMRSTTSWKATAPLRNSKILAKMVAFFPKK